MARQDEKLKRFEKRFFGNFEWQNEVESETESESDTKRSVGISRLYIFTMEEVKLPLPYAQPFLCFLFFVDCRQYLSPP